jgi:hypothetical protein
MIRLDCCFHNIVAVAPCGKRPQNPLGVFVVKVFGAFEGVSCGVFGRSSPVFEGSFAFAFGGSTPDSFN